MSTTSKSTSRWRKLMSGDMVRVQSKSGNTYEATVVLAGRDDVGLFVRLKDGKLARLLPNRVNWKTLERVGVGNPVEAGDEIIVVALGGVERRGTLVNPLDDRIAVCLPQGKVYSVPLNQTEVKQFRLLFPTESLVPGDEFLVKSKSGREYRGLAVEVSKTTIVAKLRPTKEEFTLKKSALDLSTLFVLIPVLGTSPTWEGH